MRPDVCTVTGAACAAVPRLCIGLPPAVCACDPGALLWPALEHRLLLTRPPPHTP